MPRPLTLHQHLVAPGLSEWYQSLSARTINLIGDYAGNELFMIEGDSLILTCLDTPEIDLQDGFQVLHAVWAVESFLAALVQRKANFHIVFFAENRSLCIPSSSSTDVAFKYKTVRTILIRHLCENLPGVHPDIVIKVFHSYNDTEAVNYMADLGFLFAMCHDGMVAKSSENVWKELDTSEAFLKMIHAFIQNGISIALTHSVRMQDTKIMATVIEGSRSVQAASQVTGHQHRMDSLLATRLSTGEIGELMQGLNHVTASESVCLIYCASKSLLRHDDEWNDDVRALVITSVVSRRICLRDRRLGPVHDSRNHQEFLTIITDKMSSILGSPAWSSVMYQRQAHTDVADLLDGRLFELIKKRGGEINVDNETIIEVNELLTALSLDPLTVMNDAITHAGSEDPSGNFSSIPLLPFNDPVFDKHLKSVHIRVADDDPTVGANTARTLREIEEWRKAKQNRAQVKIEQDPQRHARLLRSNQRFMTEMQAYAASLTQSIGRSLEPEKVFTVGSAQKSEPVARTKQQVGALKAANTSRLELKVKEKYKAAWKNKLADLVRIQDHVSRYGATETYLAGLGRDRPDSISSEIKLFSLDCLLRAWSSICSQDKRGDHRSLDLAALMFDNLNIQQHTNGHVKKAVADLQIATDSLGLPFQFAVLSNTVNDPMTFTFLLTKADASLRIPMTPVDFQLRYCGPYLDRSFDSKPDTRVKFQPDAWQRQVLDLIDQKKSIFVVAPTSAGKTFISFYAMKQVLQESDDGVLVYVAPTKALVNQIAAELQAQYTKKYAHAEGKSVWSIYTRDYRMNDPTGCQVLVTVPEILQIMLLKPQNAKVEPGKPSPWSTRIKRIIFDEIHCIGQAQDGIIWEQLLLMATCPIIALSATVGNPEQFYDWMKSTQAVMGIEMHMVQHSSRHSDLRKFVYSAPSHFQFHKMSNTSVVGVPSLENPRADTCPSRRESYQRHSPRH